MQAARHQAGSAVKPLGRWGETGDEREVRGEHLVGQQSGFLEFLAYKGRMCVLATLRRTLMEEREEEGVAEGWRGGQFGSLLPGHVPAIVCQPGKHFQNTWRSGVGGDSSRSSQLSDTIHQSTDEHFHTKHKQGNLFLQEPILNDSVPMDVTRLFPLSGFLEM